MTIKWGDPIECNGVRPDWLRDDEPAEIENAPGEWLEWSGCVWHKFVTAIRLPADHPVIIPFGQVSLDSPERGDMRGAGGFFRNCRGGAPFLYQEGSAL